jgi:hypothetical protein
VPGIVVAAAPAVADRDVEEAVVRTEGHPAAVVVRLGLIDRQQDQLARLVGVVRRRDRHLEARDARIAAAARVVDVEEAVALEVGVERQAEETLLVATVHDRSLDVEERAAEQHRRLARDVEDPDHARLLDDEDPVRVAGGERDEQGIDESTGDELGGERRRRRPGSARDQRDREPRRDARYQAPQGAAAWENPGRARWGGRAGCERDVEPAASQSSHVVSRLMLRSVPG